MIRAFYYQNPKAAPVPVELEEADGCLLFRNGDQIQSWSLLETAVVQLQGAEKWSLYKKTGSEESLLLEDPQFLKSLFFKYPDWGNFNKGKVKSNRSTGSKLVALFVLFIVLLGLFFWKGLPLIADSIAIRVPQSWEDELGEAFSKQVLAETPVDTAKTRILRSFYGRLLAPESHESAGEHRPIELYVIKNDVFNAFAIPGRKIFIYDGALSRMNSYSQLVALIGHEAGHVEGRHSVRTMFRSMSTYAVFAFFFGDLTGLAGVLADNANNLRDLSYSRDFEREADKAAHDFLCRNQISQKGITGLMEIMNKDAKSSGAEMPEFLSSHPLTEERLETAKAEIKSRPCKTRSEDATLQALFEELIKTN
jgi:Zn-dependent protease with chaperone function